MNDLEINRLVEFLKRVDKVAIVFHKNPDGDAQGFGFGALFGFEAAKQKL